MAAEAESVVDGAADRLFLHFDCDKVQVEAVVRFIKVNRRWKDAVMDREHGRDRLDAVGPPARRRGLRSGTARTF